MQEKTFKSKIWNYYHEHNRAFPWRETENTYHILVSEFMLQQTQTSRVSQKYPEFLKKFPTFKALASASLESVLKEWQGLGYNRRALALKKTAEEVVEKHNNTLPTTPEELLPLPGIGTYTAHAICTFAYNQPHTFIETNIRTVFIHFFFKDQPEVHDKEIFPLIETHLDHSNPRHWYYALMDYGVMLKKTQPNPNRKSTHYRKQSPFKGSNREVRSNILKTILAHPNTTSLEIISHLPHFDPNRIHKNLSTLEKEGFITQKNNRFTITS